MIPLQFALRRRMIMAGGGGAPISDLPLGALINVGTDGGAGAPNYEIADKDNLVSGGVVLVRKEIYSKSKFGSSMIYVNGTLDKLITNTIYGRLPQKLKDKMIDVTFNLATIGNITRKMFALSYTMAGFGKNLGAVEGKALQLYKSNASRIKKFNGAADLWWLSSRRLADDKWSLWAVYQPGYVGAPDPTEPWGVVFAFAIPAKTLYNLTPNTDGSYNLIL
mgnify:CR=1 FL=1